MIFLGVDTGLRGALAVLDAQGQLLNLFDTPLLTVGRKHEYDRREVKRILEMLDDTYGDPRIGFVELVHAMPGQGVVSMWRMGQGFELWMMALTMTEVAVETITPQRWKGVVLKDLPKGKDTSRYRAKVLWPLWAEWFSRKKDDGRAEASLIAEYGRRLWVKS